MNSMQTISGIIAILIGILAAIPSRGETYPIIKGASTTMKLGANQMAKQIEILSARMTSATEFAYNVKADGQPRTVIYSLNTSARSVTVTVNGGTAPLSLTAVAGEVKAGMSIEKIEVAFALKNGGKTIATAVRSPRDAASGQATGLHHGDAKGIDPLSMDVLLHLPSEIAVLNPSSLFGSEIDAQPNAIGGAAKTLLNILTLGFKYERDCETTTGPTYTCSQGCTQPADPGKCACQMCGEFCCGGTCTKTEATTTRNCSASVEIGK